MNECNTEKSIIKKTIKNSISGKNFHILKQNNMLLFKAMNNSDNFYKHFDYVLSNLKGLKYTISKYSSLLKDLIKIKNFYKKIISVIIKKKKLNLNDFSFDIEIEIEENISIKNFDDKIHKIKEDYKEFLKNKFSFKTDELLCNSY